MRSSTQLANLTCQHGRTDARTYEELPAADFLPTAVDAGARMTNSQGFGQVDRHQAHTTDHITALRAELARVKTEEPTDA